MSRQKIMNALGRHLDRCHRASEWVDKIHKNKKIGSKEESYAQLSILIIGALIILTASLLKKSAH